MVSSPEQTYRNNFENEAFDFWFTFNEYLVERFSMAFLAIAVDPSFLPKSEEDALDRTFLVRSCWRDEARSEIFGVGVIDVETTIV